MWFWVMRGESITIIIKAMIRYLPRERKKERKKERKNNNNNNQVFVSSS